MKRLALPLALTLLACAAPSAGLTSPAQESHGAAASTAAHRELAQLLQRPVVIGASISDGFGLRRETKARATIADFLAAGIAAPHDEVRSFASAYLFQDPLRRGEQQVESASNAAPSVLFALDFPFWFAYGAPLTEEQRPKLLEQGLALLERFSAPLVICDLPDMHAALNGERVLGMRMIAEAQVPDVETLAKLNRQLEAWASARPDVTLVPMARMLADLRADRPVTVRGVTYARADLARLLQPDLLHSTSEGSALLCALALDEFARKHAGLAASLAPLTPAALAKTVVDAKVQAAERAKRKGAAESAPASAPAEHAKSGG